MTLSSRRQALALGVVSLLVLFSLACGVCGSFGNPRRNQPAQPPAAAPSGGSAADIGEVVMARSVGQSNRPQDTTDTFNQNAPIIYVVAQIQRLDAGTSVFARWSRNGQPFEDTPTITADRDYTNTWLEFHIQSERGSFEPGNYTVTIFVNGNPAVTKDFVVR
ncbi:MAG: hypothetical protein M5U01_13550 [Ardenticatenaceae bacterium]|nr:hypothetical protein [Ardenticatenaceae bacterium]HBY95028.1 hypothetical protein [Chloroflexota bacterium]